MARWVLVYTLVGPLVGCATTHARVAQFDTFARAGVQFADAVPAVLDAWFETTVQTTSLLLVQSRSDLSTVERLEELARQDTVLAERLAILTDLKKHSRALRSYFLALQGLAQTDGQSSGLVDVAGGVLKGLTDLSPGIEGATVGGRPIGDLVAPAVRFTVGQFQSSMLEEELRRNASAVERELALQQAVLQATADAMRSELEAQAEVGDRDRIQLPYARDGILPSDWNQRRLDSFRRQAHLTSVDAAAQAAESLRASFIALVEGRTGDALMAALVEDVTGILRFTESLTGRS